MIEGAQRMIRVNDSQDEEPEIPINSATKRDTSHYHQWSSYEDGLIR
jgi:hypothetical protein